MSMTIIIVSSTQDEASTNIKKGLLSIDEWKENDTFFDHPVYQHSSLSSIYLVTINDKTIIHEGLEQELDEQLHLHPSQLILFHGIGVNLVNQHLALILLGIMVKQSLVEKQGH